MSYNAAVYRAQGGDELVVASSGLITIESGGSLDVESGGNIDIESGGHIHLESGGTIEIASGGYINVAAGGYLVQEVQTAATTATVITPYGLTLVTGTTAHPTFLISNPITGVMKQLVLVGSTATTANAIIAAGTTTVNFGTSGDIKITLATSTVRGVSLVGASTLIYKVVGVHTVGTAGLST